MSKEEFKYFDQKRETDHIIDRKDSSATFNTSPPVFVSTIDNFDDIAFLECQLSRFGWLERV